MDPKQLFAQAFDKHQAGLLQEAGKLYREVIQQDPGHIDAWHLSGVVAMQAGDNETATKQIRQALSLEPEYVAAHCNLGYALTALGRMDEAQASYQHALNLQPDHPDAGFNLANLLLETGKVAQAIRHYRQLLKQAPDHPGLLFNLANALLESKQLPEAIHAYGQLLSIEPDHLRAHYNCAIAHADAKEYVQAAALYKKCIAHKPEMAEPYINLSGCQLALHQFIAAEETLNSAIMRWPSFAEAYNNLGSLLLNLARGEEACQAFEKCLALTPDATTTRSNHLTTLHYLPHTTAAEILHHAKATNRYYPSQTAVKLDRPPAQPNRRLHIGYLSARFHNHPVGYFLEAVLPAHNRDQFEVFCYQNGGQGDKLTERLQAGADHWREIGALNDQAAARLINDDRIDILIDLEGHTSGHRLSLFALKPAPIQASWIGYFGTTGLSAMDYLITDRWVYPEDEQDYYVEKPAYLPAGYLCFTPPADAINITTLPARDNGYVTFGCFNNLLKVNDQVIDTWSEILSNTAGSRLFLKYRQLDIPSVAESIQSAFQTRGIDPARLILEGESPRPAYLESYNRVDIGLDPFPFSGGTTTAESLWMGVPVISLRGDRWAGRISESILRSAGMGDFVVTSRAAYVALAAAQADDIEALDQLRNGLRQTLIHSALCDGKGFTAGLEGTLRSMWHSWCEPAHLDSYEVSYSRPKFTP